MLTLKLSSDRRIVAYRYEGDALPTDGIDARVLTVPNSTYESDDKVSATDLDAERAKAIAAGAYVFDLFERGEYVDRHDGGALVGLIIVPKATARKAAHSRNPAYIERAARAFADGVVGRINMHISGLVFTVRVGHMVGRLRRIDDVAAPVYELSERTAAFYAALNLLDLTKVEKNEAIEKLRAI